MSGADLRRDSEMEPEEYGEGRAFAGRAGDFENPAVAVDDVFDDGKAKPGAAHLA